MIENYNESKNPSEGEYLDIKKYVGVGSVNILTVNPDNATLRKYGWNVPEGAEEPKYIYDKLRDNKTVRSVKVRLLAQIQDLEDKPIVPMDFWIGPEVVQNAANTKAKIMDMYGRTAWGDIQNEIKAHKIPEYANGPANISPDYFLCHRGEEEVSYFIFKYLNITPLQRFDRNLQDYVNSKNPGKFKFDKWGRLCEGDTTEILSYFGLQPDNCVKVSFGVTTTDDNRTYQTFFNEYYLGNAAKPDPNTGEYTTMRNKLDKYTERHPNDNTIFSAAPIKVWSPTATNKVEDNSGSMFDNDGNFLDDLPM